MKQFNMLFVMLAFTTGCSTFSKQQCQEMNWENQGYTSAYEGHTKADRLKYYIKECGTTHGIQPNPLAYEQGYAKGLESFCTSKRAAEFAQAGGNYQGICPVEKEQDFAKAYIPVRLSYLEKRISELESENQRLRSENSSLQSDVSSLRSNLSSAESKICP